MGAKYPARDKETQYRAVVHALSGKKEDLELIGNLIQCATWADKVIRDRGACEVTVKRIDMPLICRTCRWFAEAGVPSCTCAAGPNYGRFVIETDTCPEWEESDEATENQHIL